MIPNVPVDPEHYDLDAVRVELGVIRKLQASLALYEGREFRELPEQLRQQVRAVRSITQPTSSGLERVTSILWQLALADALLTPLSKGASIADQLTALNQPFTETFELTGPSAEQVATRAKRAPSTVPAAGTSQLLDAQQDSTSGTLTLTPPADTPRGRSASGGTLSLPVDSD